MRKVVGIKEHQGAFAEYLSLPLENLHEVPKTIPTDAAVFTEPLAAAVEILEQVWVKPASHVLVIGAGRLGQLIAKVLATTGCRLSVVARHKIQRQMLRELKVSFLQEENVPANAFDLVVDATGSPSGIQQAIKAVRPRGTIVLKSTYSGKTEMDMSALVVDEITILGSRCGPFAPALKLLEDGKVDPLPMIGARFKLLDGLKAFEHARSAGSGKVLFDLS
jgi:threonine dehydrogenase-like Zn-dependent dehydrogenase